VINNFPVPPSCDTLAPDRPFQQSLFTLKYFFKAQIHTNLVTCTHTCIYSNKNAHTLTHARTHTYTHTHIHTHTHTHTHTHAHTHHHTRDLQHALGDLTLNASLKEFKNSPLYMGGDVGGGTVQVLHPYSLPKSVEVFKVCQKVWTRCTKKCGPGVPKSVVSKVCQKV